MRRWRAMLMVLAGGLAGAACTGAPTIREVCEVLCACELPLPAQRAACTEACVDDAQQPLGEACSTCLTDIDECQSARDAVERCAEACPELGQPPQPSGFIDAEQSRGETTR